MCERIGKIRGEIAREIGKRDVERAENVAK